MTILILTPSSLIINENNKMSKVPQRYHEKCGDITNSWLDGKLPLAGLWLVLVEVIPSKERIQNYSFFLISTKMELREL